METMFMENFGGQAKSIMVFFKVAYSKLWLMFCIIIESDSQKTYFSFVLCTNMAAMTSGDNHLYNGSVFNDWIPGQ